MRPFLGLLAGCLLLSTAAWADSVAELKILQEFFSKKGIENRSACMTGAALKEFSHRPMVGEYLPETAKTDFRLLVESESSAIYEAVVTQDGLSEMWSAFFQRGLLGSRLEAIKSMNIPPYLAAVEYPRLRNIKARSGTQEARLLQLQRLFMATEQFKEDFKVNRKIYETIAHLVETGQIEDAKTAAKEAALLGVLLYAESKSGGEEKDHKLGSEVRVSGFFDSVFGLFHLSTGVSPPLISEKDYIFIETLDENWYLFRTIAARPLKEKSAKNE